MAPAPRTYHRSMLRTTPLDGPWTLRLEALGDVEAAAAAAEARVTVGLAQPGEGDRIRAAAPSPGLAGRAFPAMIPGCVHLDLMEAGVIDDPLRGTNESSQHWIARATWTYATTLPVPPPAARHELVLEGVDTDAEAWLDGQRLGMLRNVHRTYRFDVTGRLKPGGGRLELRFQGQSDVAEGRRRALGSLPSPYTDPINFDRRAACAFGWDWGPTLVTAGVWGQPRVESWTGARLAESRLSATAPGGVPRLVATMRAETDGAALPLRFRVSVAGVSATTDPVGAGDASLTLEVPAADLWWPRSHGAPVTYCCTVELLDADGVVLDRVARTVGFRDVAIAREADAAGESFAILVNGRRVWVRGANWIPDDPFPSRTTPERIAARITDAVEANMDLLRVWGGGGYESEAFYDACDRAGILVWQDFPFACAAYPEDPETVAEIEAEAREAIGRLGSHPSLAVWNGGNETTWGWFDWGWPEAIGDRPWGLGYWLDLLPRLVAELDPDRPYWPNSPWSGSMDLHPNDDRSGTSHLWEVWNDLDYTAYRERRPRFAAEYGYQAPAAWSTLRDAVGEASLAEDALAMLAHQKAGNGRAKLRRAIDRRHPGVNAFDDWHFFTQLEQARALRTGIGHLRALGEHCSGSVVWQLNDLWPVISWSLVDAAGRRKPAWHAVREAYADRIATIEPALAGAGLDLVVVNETDAVWTAKATVRRGPAEQAVTVEVPPRSSVRSRIDASVATPVDPRAEFLVATVDGAPRATWFFVDDHELAIERARWTATAVRTKDGVLITVTAQTLVRELCLFPDRLDPAATVDRQLITLLPGESAELRVSCSPDVDPEALLWPPVLRAANDGVRFG
jgi:beta-mannosidase